MDNKKVVLLLLMVLSVLILTAACTHMQDAHHSMLRSMRAPGETMEKSPEDTSQTYYITCRDPKPFMAYVEAEILPKRTYPGKELNHRVRYAICKTAALPPRGEIVRRVSYRGQHLFEDRSSVDFKPGTWTVDAFISIPPDAKPGDYSVDTTVSYRGRTERFRSFFEVKEPEE